MNIKDLVIEAHRNSTEKGFWGEEKPNIPEKLALIHSEVSEALEDYRDGSVLIYGGTYQHPRTGELVAFTEQEVASSPVPLKPVGFASELADIVIRVADLAAYLGIDLDRAITEKMSYNTTRSFKHGKKF